MWYLGLLQRGALRLVLSHCGHGRDRVTSVKKRISKWVTLRVPLEAPKCLGLVELAFACVRLRSLSRSGRFGAAAFKHFASPRDRWILVSAPTADSLVLRANSRCQLAVHSADVRHPRGAADDHIDVDGI